MDAVDQYVLSVCVCPYPDDWRNGCMKILVVSEHLPLQLDMKLH